DLRPGVGGVGVFFLVGGAVVRPRAVDGAGRGRRAPPVEVLADAGRLGQEVEHRAAGEFGLAAAARGQQFGPARAEFGVESGDEVDGLRRGDLVVASAVRAGDLHAVR